jgi:hypothetical protein
MSAVMKAERALPMESNATPLLQAITKAASDPAVDIEKMERLMRCTSGWSLEKPRRRSTRDDRLSGGNAPDRDRRGEPQTHSKYATHAKLDGCPAPHLHEARLFPQLRRRRLARRTSTFACCAYVSHVAKAIRAPITRTCRRRQGRQGRRRDDQDPRGRRRRSYGARYLLKGHLQRRYRRRGQRRQRRRSEGSREALRTLEEGDRGDDGQGRGEEGLGRGDQGMRQGQGREHVRAPEWDPVGALRLHRLGDQMNELQGTPEWLAARCGHATASEFASILAKGQGKMRATIYAQDSRRAPDRQAVRDVPQRATWSDGPYPGALRAPRLPSPDRETWWSSLASSSTRRSNAGCSPDGLIDEDGGAEIKSVIPTVQVDTILSGDYPSEHGPRCRGISGSPARVVGFRELLPGHAGAPAPLHLSGGARRAYIKTLEREVRGFLLEVQTRYDVLMGNDLKVMAA